MRKRDKFAEALEEITGVPFYDEPIVEEAPAQEDAE